MSTFTKEQSDALKAEALEILKNLDEGQNVRDVMAQIYVNNLEEKTLKQGELMADGILQSVKNFDANYQEAQENLDLFIARFQREANAGKSCVERCNYWLNLGAAVSAATAALSEDGADRDALLRELEGLSVSEEEATPEREAELRRQAAVAIRNSGVLLGTLAEQAKALAEMDDAEEAAELLIDFGGHEVEYRAVAAMLAYTKIKNGTFEVIPVDMTAAQVTAAVCAEAEQTRIMEAVGKGDLAVDVAVGLLSVLGVVLLTALALEIGILGIIAATEIFAAWAAIPACVMIASGVLCLYSKAIGAWIKDCEETKRCVMAGVRWVTEGMWAVVNFAREKVIPKIVRTASGIREKLTGPKALEAQTEVVTE